MSKIGKNIRKIRITKGLSQTAFANLFSITRASIGAYEEGRAEPKTDVMLRIAKYFSIPVETLLSEELTVNRLTNFNLKSILTPSKSENEKPILFINRWNWNTFLEGDLNEQDFTMGYPDSFLQGEFAIEIHSQIESYFSNGSIILCSPTTAPTKNGLYLFVSKERSVIVDFNELKSFKDSAVKLFLIHQKIENIEGNQHRNMEDRLNKMEQLLNQLTDK